MASRIKMVRHGFFGTPQYGIWVGIKRRCYNKNEKSYPRYGGKGVKMCKEWTKSFMAFWNDMQQGYEKGLSIDRIDNSKGYTKENCRWITRGDQSKNRGNVPIYELNGVRLNASDWDRRLGLKIGTVRARIKFYGWSIKKALTAPRASYKGFFKDSRGMYRVEVKVNGKKHWVGRFKTQAEAKKARISFLSDLLLTK